MPSTAVDFFFPSKVTTQQASATLSRCDQLRRLHKKNYYGFQCWPLVFRVFRELWVFEALFFRLCFLTQFLCLRNVCGVSVCVGHIGQDSSSQLLPLCSGSLFSLFQSCVFGIFGSNAISQMECFPNLLDLLRIKSVWEREDRTNVLSGPIRPVHYHWNQLSLGLPTGVSDAARHVSAPSDERRCWAQFN